MSWARRPPECEAQKKNGQQFCGMEQRSIMAGSGRWRLTTQSKGPFQAFQIPSGLSHWVARLVEPQRQTLLEGGARPPQHILLDAQPGGIPRRTTIAAAAAPSTRGPQGWAGANRRLGPPARVHHQADSSGFGSIRWLVHTRSRWTCSVIS